MTQWVENLPWSDIENASRTYLVDRFLLGAIVQAESSGNPKAMRWEPSWPYFYKTKEYALRHGITEETSRAMQRFSYGLCQVMGTVALELTAGVDLWLPDLCRVDVGLKYGALKLRQLTARYHGKIEDIVSAYNMGTARKDGGGAYYNQRYVDKVVGFHAELKAR